MSLWSIIAIYIGGLIGAGFASGQELVIFFVNYGKLGLAGVLFAILLLTLGTALILEVCAKRKISSYAELFTHLDPGFATIFDWLYSFFLLIGTSVMLAGIGALGATAFSAFLLRLGTALLVLVALRTGASGVGKTSTYLAPFLVIILCLLASEHLLRGRLHLPNHGSWSALEAGTLYASYNLGFSMAVLASVHGYLKTRKERWTVILVGNAILGVSMTLLFLALATLDNVALQSSFPLGYLLASKGPIALLFYQLMLWAAMYSTALANSLALVSRAKSLPSMSWWKASLLATGSAFILSYLGFSTLVRFAYPILGLAGLWILAHLVRNLFAA